MKFTTGLKCASIILGAIYFIVDANNIEYDYSWEHSLYPPFTDIEGHMHGWDYKALVSSYNFVRLTNDEKSEQGYLFSKDPLEANDWFVEFKFEIGTQGRFSGDGLAFWFTEKGFQPGAAFGHDERFKGLGVFFDTFRNGDHGHSFPYVGAMVGDGFRNYHHENDGMGALVGGCQAEIVNTKEPVRAKIIYAAKTLEVLLEINEDEGWTTCFKVPNVHIPINKGYIGFTAATGEAHSRHDILSVTTARIEKASAASFINSHKFRMTEKHSSYLAVFFLLAVIGGVVYYFYLQNQKKTRF